VPVVERGVARGQGGAPKEAQEVARELATGAAAHPGTAPCSPVHPSYDTSIGPGLDSRASLCTGCCFGCSELEGQERSLQASSRVGARGVGKAHQTLRPVASPPLTSLTETPALPPGVPELGASTAEQHPSRQLLPDGDIALPRTGPSLRRLGWPRGRRRRAPELLPPEPPEPQKLLTWRSLHVAGEPVRDP